MTVQPTRDQLRALADAATPGPWEVSGSLVGIGRTKPNIGQTWGPRWRQDIEFIAAAREAVPALLDALAAAEHRATRAEAKADVRANQTAHWQEQAGIWQEHAQWLSERAVQAEARIDAALTVLDEDTRWQNEEHLLARVRQALTA